MLWIKHPLKLEDTKISLVPLEAGHFEALIDAGRDEIIWTYMPVKGMVREDLLLELRAALEQREKGLQYPFVVIDKATQDIIGSTRFLKLNEEHKNLEIGWTWYKPSYWGRGHNEACKLLLLKYCFENLKINRVQIVASEKNARSRKAITRIGATYEGLMRHMVLRNGEKKSVAFYSIIEEEWPSVKVNLEKLLLMKSS